MTEKKIEQLSLAVHVVNKVTKKGQNALNLHDSNRSLYQVLKQ